MTSEKLKKAFTIAEAILTFALIGSIFVITITNIDITPKENYNKLYWQAFNTLLQATKSYKQDWEAEAPGRCPTGCNNDPNGNTCYLAECWRNNNQGIPEPCRKQEREFIGGTTNIDRDFPGFLYVHSMNNALIAKGQDEEFCNKIADKINVYPAGKCKSFISVANPRILKNDSSSGGKNFLKAFHFCNLDSDGNCENSDNEEGISPSFVALNGQKFYISVAVTANSPKSLGSEWESFNHPSRESYRFVVVDLNGDSKPNSQFKTGLKNPDIVLFAINSFGQVIPLGLPEMSQSYINAVIYHPIDLNEDGSRTYPKVKSDPMSLWNAKKYAWGNETCGSGLPFRSGISEIEPMSQSAKFYAVANKCKSNVKACSNKDMNEGEVYADSLFVHLVMQFLYKSENSVELYPQFTEGNCINVSSENGCEAISTEQDNPPCTIDFVH